MGGLSALVIGAGHVGTFAGWALDRDGHRVVAADRVPGPGFFRRFGPTTPVSLVEADITDAHALETLMLDVRPELVVLTAGLVGAECNVDPELAWRVNVEGARMVGAAAIAAGARGLVYLSSLAVYGRPELDLVSEDAPLQPTSVYGRTKVAAEEALWRIAEEGLAVVSLRPCGTFGPLRLGRGSRSARVIERAILLAIRGLPVEIELSAGTADELLYVKDLARAIADVAGHIDDHPPAVVNVGTGRRATVAEVHSALLGVAAPNVAISVSDGDNGGRIAMPPLDISRLREWTGYEPAFDLTTAFRDYVEVAGLR